MGKIRLLDCTLRDGGFVNDWEFGFGSIKNIICRLDKANVDIIEIGFLDQRRKYDKNRSILPDTDSVKPIFENITVENAMIVGMIDYGTCDITNVTAQKDSVLDGMRVIFKKKDYIAAIDFCHELKKKGYKVFVQPVSVTSYNEDELLKLIGKINEIKPFSVSVVDTYGLMHKTELLKYFNAYDQNMKPGINIGFHSHNNYQLAYANSLELLKIETERDLTIDGSLYGMGKGAGNANTELLALHLNKYYAKKYDVDQMLESIDVDIMKEYHKRYWGYSLMHYIAASNDCHPDYVELLIRKKTLSVKSINKLLSQIDANNKLSFNKEIIESMYLKYLQEEIDDSDASEALKKELKNNKILILAPGKSVETHSEKILDFISEHNPTVFSVNFMHESIGVDYVFMGNAKRYSQFFDKMYTKQNQPKIICTSNISEANKKIDYKFNYSTLMESSEHVKDNPVLMLLKLLMQMSIEDVYLAGFDGYYPDNKENYFGEYIQFLYCDDNVLLRNDIIKNRISEMQVVLKITFLTPSAYV